VLNVIADVLDVSPLALSVPEIEDDLVLLHTLFALEDLYGLKLSFDGTTMYAQLVVQAKKDEPLYPKLYFWQVMKRRVVSGEIAKQEYDDWRYGLT